MADIGIDKLLKIHNKLATECNVATVMIGTGALRMRGVDVPVPDIDVLVETTFDVDALCRLLPSDPAKPMHCADVDRMPDEHELYSFTEWKHNGVKIHVIPVFRLSDPTATIRRKVFWSNANKGGRVASIIEATALKLAAGRDKDIKTIASYWSTINGESRAAIRDIIRFGIGERAEVIVMSKIMELTCGL